MNYTLKPDFQGYLTIDNKNGTYKPGDIIFLSGSFKAVAIYNLSGVSGSPIKVTNVPGEKLTIGDPKWSGGSWSHGLALRNCKYLEIHGSNKSSFVINGSTSDAKDSNGYPVRTAYFNFIISEFSENMSVHDLTIRDGGVGIVCKTDRNGDTILQNFEFYNLEIFNTYNEALYIGSTSSTPDSSGKYPYKLKNVKVHHNYIHDIWNDAIQIATADNVEVYNNEIVRWGLKREYSHSGGILMGGRIKGFNVHDNIVKDGFGNMLQIFSEAGTPSSVSNNLFLGNELDAVYIRGASNLVVKFTGNTVAGSKENLIRVSGSRAELSKNILAAPLGGISNPTSRNYIYLENGGTVADVDNIKIPKVADIGKYPDYGYNGTIITLTTTSTSTTSTTTGTSSTSTTTSTSSSTTTTSTTLKVAKLLCTVIAEQYTWDLYNDGTSTVRSSEG